MTDKLQTAPASAAIAKRDATDVEVAARVQAEIQGQMTLAKRFPRDELTAEARIVKSCKRPRFAERASYGFQRGGRQITGPTVNLARESARHWGNLIYGLEVLKRDDEEAHIRAWAFDLETGTKTFAEDRVSMLVQRKRGGETVWVKPDERDSRELVNKRGAICVRNCLLQLIPPDVIEIAQAAAYSTLQQASEGELADDRDRVIRGLVGSFQGYGVTREMLEEFLGHDIRQIDADEVAKLKTIGVSIRDGNTNAAEHFPTKPKAKAAGAKPTIRPEQIKKKAAPKGAARGGDTELASVEVTELPEPVPEGAKLFGASREGGMTPEEMDAHDAKLREQEEGGNDD